MDTLPSYDLKDVPHGQKYRQGQEEHQAEYEGQEYRLERGGQVPYRGLHLPVVVVGDLLEHLIEVPGLLPHGDHLHDHGLEVLGPGHGRREGAPGAHLLLYELYLGGHGPVLNGPGDYVERLEYGQA